MSKTGVFTTIFPRLARLDRQSMLDTYYNHVEMIDLNLLIVDRFGANCPPTQQQTYILCDFKDDAHPTVPLGITKYTFCFTVLSLESPPH
jgi:hypothetical protein